MRKIYYFREILKKIPKGGGRRTVAPLSVRLWFVALLSPEVKDQSWKLLNRDQQ